MTDTWDVVRFIIAPLTSSQKQHHSLENHIGFSRYSDKRELCLSKVPSDNGEAAVLFTSSLKFPSYFVYVSSHIRHICCSIYSLCYVICCIVHLCVVCICRSIHITQLRDGTATDKTPCPLHVHCAMCVRACKSRTRKSNRVELKLKFLHKTCFRTRPKI